jgi:hypothetical protein
VAKSPQQADKPAPANERATIKIESRNDRSREQVLAEIFTQPQVLAARTIFELNRQQTDLDLTTLLAEINAQCRKASAGDLSRIEGMLLAQSLTLDALFNKLIARAMSNAEAGYLNASETYLRLALRAQSQARATGETLGVLKNPPGIAFVRQANIAHGPQQINNKNFETSTRARAQARGNLKIRQTNYWSKAMANGWAAERKARQAALIQGWKPWERSTGPKTTEGKTRVARNAYKGGIRVELRALARLLRSKCSL